MTAADLLADLLLPRRCIACGRDGTPWCAGCRPEAGIVRVGAGGLDVMAAARYDTGVRRALLAYKERGRRDLLGPLALLLARAVFAALGAGAGAGAGCQVVLVPVPSSRSAAAARGGDHLLRLAARAGRVTGLRTARDAVVLTRRVADSAGLDVGARAANLHGAFGARHAPPGRSALLVDDIVTTGATLREATRALRAAGWPVAGAAVVAATPRRMPRPTGARS